ncbi:pds [Scenedesmus sp. PABB004]|nr:pds [Scenedesmus sp. PABB004]
MSVLCQAQRRCGADAGATGRCQPVRLGLHACLAARGARGSSFAAAPTRARRSWAPRAAAADDGPAGDGRPKVVVVGGGWAGFGAAKHLAEQGYAVTLVDAAKNPGGLSTGFRNSKGQALEAGMKGMWYTYSNIFALLRDLGASSGAPWPLTDFTTSGFWSPAGLTTEAPVFSRLPRLPTPLGQFVHTAPLFWSLPLSERLTMLPFLLRFVDFDASPEVYERYDKMSARELFRQCGVSQRMYEEFLRPTLLVGLFAPPEDVSAAVMLECLYFYALAHQNDFDVCWPRGSVAETIFTPMVQRITAAGSQVLGGQLVVDVLPGPDGASARGVVTRDVSTGATATHAADAVVFAVGVTGMQKLVSSVPLLGARAEFRRTMSLRALDVVATRLFLDRRVPTRYPANVLSGFERSAGATYFNLNDLQDEYRDAPGSVIASDFYNASELLPLSDDEVPAARRGAGAARRGARARGSPRPAQARARRAPPPMRAQIVARVKSHLEACEPAFRDAAVVDSAVLRFPKAVTHFSPGSYVARPYQVTSLRNVFIAGDWVKGVPHGANGLSQERALVTGLIAANLVIDACGGRGAKAVVLDVEPDEPHVAAAKAANQAVRGVLDGLGLRSPLL